MQAYIPETIETRELLQYHADKAHPVFVSRLEQAENIAEELEEKDEVISNMWSDVDAAEKAADTLAEILDYAAEGTGHHRGSDYFESLRASKKADREAALAEFMEDIRTQLGDIYAALNAAKDR